MYRNIGAKIQEVAQTLGIICLAMGIPLAIIAAIVASWFVGAMILLGAFAGVFVTWLIFGFGQLIEDTRGIRCTIDEIAASITKEEKQE